MTAKKSIWGNTLFIGIVLTVLTLIGGVWVFKYQFNWQRKTINEDTQSQDIITLKYDIVLLKYENIALKNQIRSNRIIDSLDYNEQDKELIDIKERVTRLERKIH
jgi:hypothetical protein